MKWMAHVETHGAMSLSCLGNVSTRSAFVEIVHHTVMLVFCAFRDVVVCYFLPARVLNDPRLRTSPKRFMNHVKDM